MEKTGLKCELIRAEGAPPGGSQAQRCVAFNTVSRESSQHDDAAKRRHNGNSRSFNRLGSKNHYMIPLDDGMDIADGRTIGLT
jgi:hypothetical protein